MQLEMKSALSLRLFVEDGYMRVHTWLIDVGGGRGGDLLECSVSALCSGYRYLVLTLARSFSSGETKGQVRSAQVSSTIMAAT
jgi:hypothetical protein